MSEEPKAPDKTPHHPYLISFLLVLTLTVICIPFASVSYRSEVRRQEEAEQQQIQKLHEEFLSQKDHAAAKYIASVKEQMQDALRPSTFEDLTVNFSPISREEFLSLSEISDVPADSETVSSEQASYFYSISFQSDNCYSLYQKGQEADNFTDVVKKLQKFQNRISFYPPGLDPNPADLEVGSGKISLYFYLPDAYISFSITDSNSHTLTFQFDRDLLDFVLLEGDTIVYSPLEDSIDSSSDLDPATDSSSTTHSGNSSGTTHGGMPGLSRRDSVVSGKNQTTNPSPTPKRDDFYDVYDYDDPEDFYYDNEDDFDSYEDAEDYYDDAWDD